MTAEQQWLEVHVQPFKVNDKTYRVTGTRSYPAHTHDIYCEETKEHRVLNHDTVKRWQLLAEVLDLRKENEALRREIDSANRRMKQYNSQGRLW